MIRMILKLVSMPSDTEYVFSNGDIAVTIPTKYLTIVRLGPIGSGMFEVDLPDDIGQPLLRKIMNPKDSTPGTIVENRTVVQAEDREPWIRVTAEYIKDGYIYRAERILPYDHWRHMPHDLKNNPPGHMMMEVLNELGILV